MSLLCHAQGFALSALPLPAEMVYVSIFRVSHFRIPLFLVLVIFVGVSCKKKETSPDVPAPTNPPLGEVDNSAGFYLRHIETGKANFYTHKGLSTFSERCVAAEGEDIACYTEGNELDLHYQGISLQYNVPSNLCAYFTLMPYYYYQKAAGAGPTVVRKDTDSTGAVGTDNDNDGLIDGAVATCQFDYSASSKPNCCSGDYTEVSRSWDATATVPGYQTTSVSEGSWGGKASNCLYGPAMDTQELTEDGFPTPTIYFTEGQGINDKYVIASPLSKKRGSSIFLANFFQLAEHAGAKPAAVAFPYYQLTCLDRAYEVKARISLMIREWNTVSDFNLRESVVTGHDRVGAETSTIGDFNDFDDWLDIDSPTGTYPGFDR